MKSYPAFHIAGCQGLRIDPRQEARAVLLLLHGYAMDPMDLAPLAEAMGLPVTLYLPNGVQAAEPRGRAWWPVDAGRRAAQIAAGARDLFSEHPPGRAALRSQFCSLASDLAKLHGGLPLILAGFSQGGMLACDLVLQSDLRPQALVLLSTSCIALDEWQPRLKVVHDLPVFIAHGREDQDLSIRAGERLMECLCQGGADVRWLPFDGGHGIPLAVWRGFKQFVLGTLESLQERRLNVT